MRFLVAVCLAFLALALPASGRIPQNDAERTHALNSLKWSDEETLTLPVSGSTLRAPPPVRQLAGIEAARVWTALSGAPTPSGTEAMLHDPRTGEIVFYQKLRPGYVRFDDWGKTNLDVLLKSVAQITDFGNIRRRQLGMPGLRVVGWLQPPSLDRAANSVSWAIESSDDNGQPVINSMALIFGRDGFEKLIWRGKAMFKSTNLLKIGQSSFSFPAGLRYADYEIGDRVSEFGVTDTIAAVLGMKRPTQR